MRYDLAALLEGRGGGSSKNIGDENPNFEGGTCAPLFRPLIPWKRPKANIDHIDPKVCEEARKSYSKEGIQREISRYTWLAQNIFVFFGKKEVRFMF